MTDNSTGPRSWSGGERDDIEADMADRLAINMPSVSVVRGVPDDVELAALMAGIASTTSDVADGLSDMNEAETPPGVWTSRANQLGMAPSPGPHAWRWS